jgi:hypothetical protein
MARKKPASLGFFSGISLGLKRAKVIAQKGELDPDHPVRHIMEWNEGTGWTSFSVPLSAISLHQSLAPPHELFVMGTGGFVRVIADGTQTEEMVDLSDEGPRYRGNIRAMRQVGDHLYAVGMSRQVYRREGRGRWLHDDAGMIVPLGSVEVVGLNCIDGPDESEIYAAGFDGEIWWRHEGRWRRVDSPTNMILREIRTIKPDLIYMCGQMGIVLKGYRDTWDVIAQDESVDNFWGMAWFRDHLYVASHTAIYRLRNEKLVRIKTGLRPKPTFGRLHATNGALWSFGPDRVVMYDRKSWTDHTPRKV